MVKKPPSFTRFRLEERIEQKACEKIKDFWPTVLIRKMGACGSNDWPDRMVILPGVPAFFIEFKRPGLTPRRSQDYIINRIKELGSHVYVCTSVEEAIANCNAEFCKVHGYFICKTTAAPAYR